CGGASATQSATCARNQTTVVAAMCHEFLRDRVPCCQTPVAQPIALRVPSFLPHEIGRSVDPNETAVRSRELIPLRDDGKGDCTLFAASATFRRTSSVTPFPERFAPR